MLAFSFKSNSTFINTTSSSMKYLDATLSFNTQKGDSPLIFRNFDYPNKSVLISNDWVILQKTYIHVFVFFFFLIFCLKKILPIITIDQGCQMCSSDQFLASLKLIIAMARIVRDFHFCAILMIPHD